MAKIIVSCRFQKSAKDIADLIRYMATREGVEKLPDTKKYNLSSSKQDDLILSVVKHFPQSKKFLEPTRENANEFLDAVAERYADQASELKGLVSYISNRPGVEKLGSHGLFTQFDMPIDLDSVAERVATHDGVIWTEVVSLRREDAERLHFNNAEAWKNLVRRNMNEFAKDGDLSEIYSKWNEVNREKLSLYYDTKDKPDVPIEKNPELRSLKNMLIRTALGMNFNAQTTVNR